VIRQLVGVIVQSTRVCTQPDCVQEQVRSTQGRNCKYADHLWGQSQAEV